MDSRTTSLSGPWRLIFISRRSTPRPDQTACSPEFNETSTRASLLAARRILRASWSPFLTSCDKWHLRSKRRSRRASRCHPKFPRKTSVSTTSWRSMASQRSSSKSSPPQLIAITSPPSPPLRSLWAVTFSTTPTTSRDGKRSRSRLMILRYCNVIGLTPGF